MIILYKNVHCPLCKEHHDLWMEESRTGLTYKPHEFLCPATKRRTAWHPDVFAHIVEKSPQDGVELVPLQFGATAAG